MRKEKAKKWFTPCSLYDLIRNHYFCPEKSQVQINKIDSSLTNWKYHTLTILVARQTKMTTRSEKSIMECFENTIA